MIIHLPQMVPQMRGQMDQKISGRHGMPEYLLWVFLLKLGFGEPVEGMFNDGDGFVNAGEEFGAGHIFQGKFCVAVADIAALAELGADVSAEVTGEVQAEVAGGIGDAFVYDPEGLFFAVAFHFLFQAEEVAAEEGFECFGEHVALFYGDFIPYHVAASFCRSSIEVFCPAFMAATLLP